jgi:predicted ATP-binding protein involved in virulence
MIERILTKRLFGLYDYDVVIHPSPAVKILTGPNGYGKSTMLLAIDHLYRGDFWYFHFLDFEQMTITLSEQVVDIKKTAKAIVVTNDENRADDTDAEFFEVTVTLLDKEGQEIETVVISEEYVMSLIFDIRRRVAPHEPQQHSDEELLARYYSQRNDDYIQDHSRNISLALQEYDTKYLSAQRLYNHTTWSQREFRPLRYHHYEIDNVNEEICTLYRRTQNTFASTSQRIDATFISRLVKRQDSYSKEVLQNKLDELKKRIDGFKELNLFSNMELLDYSLEDGASYEKLDTALSLYVDDMNAKMDKFEELYQKMSLYKRVVTNKVLSEKTINFSEEGLTVMNSNGGILRDLHKLSSGEQNLLILYYNLIFKSNGKTILLIDEPENSLHVAWQSKMLDDYIEMSKTTGCQILMATHSPTFINGRWDLTTDLYRQYKGKDV